MSDELAAGYDVIVIGGGAAGLNGALMLARSKRSVAVIDAGVPRNAPADGVHGLLGHDGVPPLELLRRGVAEVRSYGGTVVDGEAAELSGIAGDFEVALHDSRRVRARRLLVTTGLVDELPAIPGLRERWGKDVVHCPYCHGWEVRDRPIGVLATGPMSVHQALLFSQLSGDVLLFRGDVELAAEQEAQLGARGVRIVDGPVAQVVVENDEIAGVRLVDGSIVDRRVIVVATRMVARGDFLAGIGVSLVEHPSGMGVHLPVDPTGRTEVPGVWAAGNVTDLTAQVGASAAAGAMAGAQINADLVMEEVAAALAVP
ncbi:NAD(P)/FAD-dependent oxidoreductase [Flexivirga meconopsidis]|uniref:NAD(P)/FAD-dependent oxidoreductase n=1 Tax=Flexivirga meconopsidis TaxID=2977121 RepID=UPI00223FDC78|nr:NAD(P)/FAD-dependent oxidoreductase [Flexivirga meconopsidis]